MPYLNSKLSEKHRASCKDPKAKRLYIRDYDVDKRKQIFIPYGITCPTCKVIILDNEPIAVKSSIDKAQAQTQVKPKASKIIAITRPVKKVKKKELSVKEMSRYGEVIDCTICHKPRVYPKPAFLIEGEGKISRKYKLEGSYAGYSLLFIYPDGKFVEPSRVSTVFICNTCLRKHFERDDHIDHRPKTEKGRQVHTLRVIPYPEAKIQ